MPNETTTHETIESLMKDLKMTDHPTTHETITHERAREAARRLIAGSFRRDGEHLDSDKRPWFSIPARPDHDDDLVLCEYIRQQKAMSEFALVETGESDGAESERTQTTRLRSLKAHTLAMSRRTWSMLAPACATAYCAARLR